MPTIAEINTAPSDIVVSERVVTNQYRVVSIDENVQRRYVRVVVETGPWNQVSPELTIGQHRSLVVWENAEYDQVRDSWDNSSLLSRITQLLT